jgi:hypothetical protein
MNMKTFGVLMTGFACLTVVLLSATVGLILSGDYSSHAAAGSNSFTTGLITFTLYDKNGAAIEWDDRYVETDFASGNTATFNFHAKLIKWAHSPGCGGDHDIIANKSIHDGVQRRYCVNGSSYQHNILVTTTNYNVETAQGFLSKFSIVYSGSYNISVPIYIESVPITVRAHIQLEN